MAHYNAAYLSTFDGLDIGRQHQSRYFKPYCKPTSTLLDFGSADGLMLRMLPAKRRIGIEINRSARAICSGVDEIHDSIAAVASNTVDVAISNHCLEHVPNPLESLRQIHRALKPGGALVIVVPFESEKVKWAPNDPNMHLYTWAPVNLGNILCEAGFVVHSVSMKNAAWHPKMFWTRHLGLFNLSAWGLGHLLHRREVFAVARKG